MIGLSLDRAHISSVILDGCLSLIFFPIFDSVRSLRVSDSLRPHGLQHARLPCPSPTPGACSDLCSSSWWCRPTILSSVVPFSCLQSFPVLGSFLMSQLLASSGQSIGASAPASVLPVSIQAWFPLADILTDIFDYIQFNFSLWLTFVSCILFLEVHCRNVGFWR